jgi:putative nucleotidyltransferase with HDIG domain
MPLPHTSGDPSKIDASESIIVRPESLRLGMYVDLNCSWFKHPFPRRSFKITSQSQITTIQGLGLATVLVYPRESDPETATDTPPPSSPSMPTTIPDQALDTTSVGQGSPASDTEIPTHSDYHQAVELASEAYRQVLQRSSQMMKDLSTGSLEGLRSANVMISGISTLLTNTEAAGTVASAFNPEDIDNLTVLHALNVATLSMMVAQHFDIAQDKIQLIGLAGLLLDIGEQRLPRRILENRSQLSQLETVEYQHHPYYAVEMLRQYPGFPEEVLDIIRSHHERLDGSGYPEKLKGDEISLSARIVGAVEQYDALINNFDPKQAVSPAEALAWMYRHQKHLFAPDVVVAMIHTFGVYPPGTVVALSEGSLGLVLNINFESRLKPLILIYDPTATKDHPPVVDLSLESRPAIVRAMSKAELPHQVAEYFHLKRWTGYFIQSSMRSPREEAAA